MSALSKRPKQPPMPQNTDPMPTILRRLKTTHQKLVANVTNAEKLVNDTLHLNDGAWTTALDAWGKASQALYLWRESEKGKKHKAVTVKND